VEVPSGFARVEEGRDEAVYRASLTGASAAQAEAAVRRIHDLARWHCVCCLLGYPPLRLLCEE